MNIFQKIFKRYDPKKDIDVLNMWNSNLSDHIITLARLSFIKPELFMKESKNIKANGEYIVQMLEAMQKERTYEDKRPNIQPKKRTA